MYMYMFQTNFHDFFEAQDLSILIGFPERLESGIDSSGGPLGSL